MKTIATIIGRLPLTETSLIVKWCSEDSGIIKTVAKGARRPKSPFAGKIDLFFRCEIEVHLSKKSDLHILKELDVLDSRFGLRRSYLQTLGGSYFVKLIEKAAEPATPIAELDNLLGRALDYLNDNEVDLRGVLHFEKQMAEILGIYNQQTIPSLLLNDHFGGLPGQRSELIDRLNKKVAKDNRG